MSATVGTVSVPQTVPVKPPREWAEKMAAEHGPMKISPNAKEVLARRYLKKEDGTLETPEEMCARVAWNIALAEAQYCPAEDAFSAVAAHATRFYRLIHSLQFLPNSPTLMNAGKVLQQLSACFVLPVGDSMPEIFESVKNTALIHKSGGGTGFSFSRLRPKNDAVASTKGVSSGPISFMGVFDAATETIKQGGTRRGANMGILRVDHPDVLEFIACKDKTDRLNNFNISVAATESFMQAVEAGEKYGLVNPRSKTPAGELDAREVFEKIVEHAWRTGEPGIVFIDRINDDNPTPHVGEIESTNPCGEQPLLPYESCNLGSLNLGRFLAENGGVRIDYDRLKQAIHDSIRFLDNVVDMNLYPLPQIQEMTKGNRKVGLGVMGFADALARIGIPYDSEGAAALGRELMSFVQNESKKASMALALERGTFPNYPGSVYEKRNLPVRNATTTTIAPTGTISIIADASSGIEPYFALAYIRNVMDNDRLPEVNPHFEAEMKTRGLWTEEIAREVGRKGGVHDVDGVPQDIKEVYRTAHDITPEWHLKMQAAFQEATDNAVSKTVNFPQSATREDVRSVFLLAYQLGCKGVTVYRDKSRDAQVLNIGAVNEAGSGLAAPAEPVAAIAVAPKSIEPRPRPDLLNGSTREMKTSCGSLYVTINSDGEGIFEIFNQMGKAGGCAASQSEAIGRLASIALRSGVRPEAIVKQLRGISCHRPRGLGDNRVASCADAIAAALEWYVDNVAPSLIAKEPSAAPAAETAASTRKRSTYLETEAIAQGACPDCGAQPQFEEGCMKCPACGYSEC